MQSIESTSPSEGNQNIEFSLHFIYIFGAGWNGCDCDSLAPAPPRSARKCRGHGPGLDIRRASSACCLDEDSAGQSLTQHTHHTHHGSNRMRQTNPRSIDRHKNNQQRKPLPGITWAGRSKNLARGGFRPGKAGGRLKRGLNSFAASLRDNSTHLNACLRRKEKRQSKAHTTGFRMPRPTAFMPHGLVCVGTGGGGPIRAVADDLMGIPPRHPPLAKRANPQNDRSLALALCCC